MALKDIVGRSLMERENKKSNIFENSGKLELF